MKGENERGFVIVEMSVCTPHTLKITVTRFVLKSNFFVFVFFFFKSGQDLSPSLMTCCVSSRVQGPFYSSKCWFGNTKVNEGVTGGKKSVCSSSCEADFFNLPAVRMCMIINNGLLQQSNTGKPFTHRATSGFYVVGGLTCLSSHYLTTKARPHQKLP